MQPNDLHEATEALRRIPGRVVLVEPSGETWRAIVEPSSAEGSTPLVDMCTPFPHAARVELAQYVLRTVREEGMLALVEPIDTLSPAPDLAVVASLPRLGARLRAGRRDVRWLVEALGTADGHAAECALKAGGAAVWPAIRERLSLLLERADDQPEPLWSIVRVLEESSIPLGPVLDLLAEREGFARELMFHFGNGARWYEVCGHLLDRIASSNDVDGQRELHGLLYASVFDGSDRVLPRGAESLLVRSLAHGVDPSRVAMLLLVHGWAIDDALAALAPAVEAQLASFDGEYDTEIELSTVAYAIGASGTRCDSAVRLLANIEASAAGNLLKSVAQALGAIGTDDALALLRTRLARLRVAREPYARSDREFRRAVEASLVIALARAEGRARADLFRELWEQEGGLFVDMEICSVLPWLFEEAGDLVLASLDVALRGEAPHRVYPLLRVLGTAGAPLADAVRAGAAHRERTETLSLLFEITNDPEIGRQLLATDPASGRRPPLLDLAIADAVSEDEGRQRVALDALACALGLHYRDPVWRAFREALEAVPSDGWCSD